MKLRPYQEVDLQAIRQAYRDGHKSPLFVAPTGYGKTVLFSHIAASAAARGNRVTILCHRAELIEQIVTALRAVGVNPGIIAADAPTSNATVQVASVWTLINRLHRYVEPHLLVVDEAHHAVQKTTWGRILSHYSNARRLGVTATPCRLSGEGLCEMFDTLVLGPSIADLTEQGYLTPARVFAPTTVDVTGIATRGGDYAINELEDRLVKSSITGDAITHYRNHAQGRRAIAFCVSVAHAIGVASAFTEAGISSAHIDGTMDKQTRAARIASFRRGETLVLTSCDLVSEGFDLPAIECGILLRPTQSTALYLQQVGRCLRTFEGKRHAIILDHSGNSLKHGLPSEPREWSLQATEKKDRKKAEPIGKRCEGCYAIGRVGATVCAECGTPYKIKERKIERVEGDLKEVTSTPPRKKRTVNAADTLEGLTALATMRGYKNPRGWAYHVWQARLNKRIRETRLE